MLSTLERRANVSPQRDLVYSALYLFTSVSVALVAGLAFMALVHRLLNRFELTRGDAYLPSAFSGLSHNFTEKDSAII